jgi:hypothetical protein
VRRGGVWKFGPTPLAGTVFRIDYYDEFPALSAPSDSNFLTAGPTDLVIYAALSYAGDWFVDKRAATWEARFQSIVTEIQNQADQDALINAEVSSAYDFPTSKGSPVGNSSFFNNPNDYQTVDEGGEGSGFYDGPAYTQIDPVAIANSVAAAAASAADAAAHDASATAHDASSAIHDTSAAAAAAAALVSQNAAAASAADALTQKNAAVTAAGVSVDAAGVATDQATIATTQAGIATTKAGEAATSATIAGSQATTATTQAGIATTKAGEAATSASNAATSAANAASAVQAVAGTASPLMDGVAAVGTGTKWAREDHKHPSDTAKADKTYVDTQDALKAPLASPALTGTPTAPTPTAGDNSTKLSTTAFVAAAIAALVNSSPAALDTLNELAAALGNDPNFATTITNALALKAPLASPALTGTPTAPTPTAGDNSTNIATTAFITTALSSFTVGRPLASGHTTWYVAKTGSDSNTGKPSGITGTITFTNGSANIGWTAHGRSVGDVFASIRSQAVLLRRTSSTGDCTTSRPWSMRTPSP